MGHSRPLVSFANVLLDTRDEKVRQAGRILDCPVLTTISGGPRWKTPLVFKRPGEAKEMGMAAKS
ncbi:MAG: hypothetical protein NTX04_03890 [Verrucomicrobia bacterium]|nr:hypothetical protein [Verrucomicrobiota bacterium]